MIFSQGFLPLALDKSTSNCREAVLVLVHLGYIISPVPNKKLRTGSVEKQRGMAFGFRKRTTAVKKNQIDMQPDDGFVKS